MLSSSAVYMQKLFHISDFLLVLKY